MANNKYEMDESEFYKINKITNTDILTLIMDHKHKRISSSQMCDIIQFYVESL